MHSDKNIFMAEAIKLAADNLVTGKGGPFGAVVVKNGIIVGRGGNSVTSSNDPTAHAEVNAIRDACKNLNTFQLDDCEIYTSCEPCPMCLGAIYWARPKKIFYACSKKDASNAGFDDSFIYEEINIPLSERKIPAHQMMQDEALEVFKNWNDLENKIEY
ncbi:MAG: nucleoside deaminase [Bacteroidales bacterium]